MLAYSDDDETHVVNALPKRPVANARYSFSRVSRADVTAGTHALHKYPAKFIPQIPRWALQFEPMEPASVVLDPFCGSGTTLVEAGLRGYNSIGFDISPLAVEIARAKCWIPRRSVSAESLLHSVIHAAKKREPQIRKQVVSGTDFGLHDTWDFWFEQKTTAQLLALRYGIEVVCANDPGLRSFLLSCLSSVLKASSYLDEDQIKVRYIKGKEIADPFAQFSGIVHRMLPAQLDLAQAYRRRKVRFDVAVGDARSLPIADRSVDRVITSPPYINAVDYTMAHKYNLFLLGLVAPATFKSHCRDYIGMTERAVRTKDHSSKPEALSKRVQDIVDRIWSVGTATACNRSFIVATYFDGMLRAFQEMARTLKSGGKVVLVVGETNRICGIEVPTADLLSCLSQEAGFTVDLQFRHELANRSSMRLNRSSTGGVVKCERVLVLRNA